MGEFCKMGFTQNGNLRAHIRRVHSIEVSDVFLCLMKLKACHIIFSFREMNLCFDVMSVLALSRRSEV